MSPFAPFPQTATVTDLQRRPRAILDRVKKSKEPLFVMRNNVAEVVMLDPSVWHAQQHKDEKAELREAKKAWNAYKKAKREGKLARLKGDLSNLLD